MSPGDGWCDEPGDPAYNRLVTRPYPARHETLWREDDLYDLIFVLDQNFTRRKKRRRQRDLLPSRAAGPDPDRRLRAKKPNKQKK